MCENRTCSGLGWLPSLNLTSGQAQQLAGEGIVLRKVAVASPLSLASQGTFPFPSSSWLLAAGCRWLFVMRDERAGAVITDTFRQVRCDGSTRTLHPTSTQTHLAESANG